MFFYSNAFILIAERESSMAQIKQNIRTTTITMDTDLYGLLDHVAVQTKQPKSKIIEIYLSRGIMAWYEKNEPDSPSFAEYKKGILRKEI